jgi:hypothetical protein
MKQVHKHVLVYALLLAKHATKKVICCYYLAFVLLLMLGHQKRNVSSLSLVMMDSEH